MGPRARLQHVSPTHAELTDIYEGTDTENHRLLYNYTTWRSWPVYWGNPIVVGLFSEINPAIIGLFVEMILLLLACLLR